MMQLETNHALSVMCWQIIPELAEGEVALLWFTGIRLLLKRWRWRENLIRVFRMDCAIFISQSPYHRDLSPAVLR